MQRRTALLIALGLLCASLGLFDAAAAGPSVVIAQEVGEGEEEGDVGAEENTQQSETGGGEADDQESGGADEPEAETGSGAEGTEEAATETGPPWTYQMARLALGALVLLALAIAGAYYRFVVMRQRGAV
jgi:hypothetical protein